jgi:hypothetical protein
LSFLAYLIANLYCWIVVPSSRTVPQMVDAFYVKEKITRGGCVGKLKLALVLLDFFETCI